MLHDRRVDNGASMTRDSENETRKMPRMNATAIRDRFANDRFAALDRLTTSVLKKMVRTFYARSFRLLVLVFFLNAPVLLQGQADSTGALAIQLNRLTSFSALPNGIDLRDGDARMQIVA